MSQIRLATQVNIDQSYVSLFERTGYLPGPAEGDEDRLGALRAALEAAGIEFVEDAQRPNVRLRKAEPTAN